MTMSNIYENAARDFLELASEQRLTIIFKLLEKRARISPIAKELEATVQEVHRNFERLEEAGLIAKDVEGYYDLTPYGKTICTQVPSIVFLSQNRKYFGDHDFGDLPMKFIQRIGALAEGQRIKGFAKVLEQWKSIFRNSNEYIYEILSEVPLDIIEPKVDQVKRHNVILNYILAKNTIVPKGRKQILEKLKVYELIKQGKIERRMRDTVQVVAVLNEKEACVSFPTRNGEADLREAFYSKDVLFHEWCLDYYRYCWYGSSTFQEKALEEE